jgi:hypothetical protein
MALSQSGAVSIQYRTLRINVELGKIFSRRANFGEAHLIQELRFSILSMSFIDHRITYTQCIANEYTHQAPRYLLPSGHP